MALNACTEAFWRIFFELLKYSIDNWIFVLILLFIVSIFVKFIKGFGPIIVSLFPTLLDFGLDSLFIGTLGTSTLISVLGGMVIGFLWATIPLSRADVTPLVRYLNAIFFFLFGTIVGIVPSVILSALAIVTGILIQFSKAANYVLGFALMVLLYYLVSFSSVVFAPVCSGINHFLTLL